MKVLLVIVLLVLCIGIVYAGTIPQMLIDKNTKQIISWGYCDFKPLDNQEVISGYILKGNIEDGLIFKDDKEVLAPEYKIETKSDIQDLKDRVETLEGKVTSIQTIKVQ